MDLTTSNNPAYFNWFDYGKSKFDVTSATVNKDDFSVTCAGKVAVTWFVLVDKALSPNSMDYKVKWQAHPNDKGGYLIEILDSGVAGDTLPSE